MHDEKIQSVYAHPKLVIATIEFLRKSANYLAKRNELRIQSESHQLLYADLENQIRRNVDYVFGIVPIDAVYIPIANFSELLLD